jgi:DNA helicase-2/ATP-dependent DNA helicase PcrA
VIDTQALLADLTEPQRKAATHTDGPLLIIAGAGSGKTRVITRRVAYLVGIGIPPPSILAITFTNKAAGEMKERVGQALGRQVRDFGRLDQYWPTVCTFHSLCLRILKHYGPRVGLPTNFTVYDSSDQNKLIKDAIKTLELSSTNFAPATVHGTISNAKNQLQSPEAFLENARDFYQKQVARIYAKYQQLLAAANALDFDDLLLRTNVALRDHPDVLSELQDRFQYVMIDEYQDTNRAQYVLVHMLAMKHRNVAVVGDPDQSIYRWRGADLRNILDFEQDYPDATVVKLEQNYRSTKTILHLASTLIANNTQRKDKTLWTENDQGERAKLVLCQDERDEAQVVADELRRLNGEQKIQWSDMAIFYRMNSLSRVMEDALRKASIPYQIARGVEFYNRKEIKDVVAYLRVIANPNDEVSLERIVNTPPRGISDATYNAVQAQAAGEGVGVYEMMRRVDEITSLQARAIKSVQQFVQQVESWRAAAGGALAARPVVEDVIEEPAAAEDEGEPDMFSGVVAARAKPQGGDVEERVEFDDEGPSSNRIRSLMERVVRESGYEALLRKLDPDAEEQIPNVNELISSAAEFDLNNADGTLDEYLQQISLVADVDHMDGSGGAVTMMTLHAAKGLEFPVVAMIGLEDGVLPHSRSRDSYDELEEERRLCFVGITRAQQHLLLTKANYRTIRGLRERTAASKFIAELPQDGVEVIDRGGLDYDPFDDTRIGAARGSFRDRGDVEDKNVLERQRAALAAEAERINGRFKRGQAVRHPQFGLGRIVELQQVGQHTRASIDFVKAGRKTLILQYAKLDPV